MYLIHGSADRGPVLAIATVCFSVVVLASTLFTRLPTAPVAFFAAFTIILVVWQRPLLAWRSLVAAITVVIFFIPIRHYVLPGNLPFELDPYRVVLGLVLLGWFGSLLVDSRVRWRATGLEAPLLLFVGATVASVVVNWTRVNALGVEPETLKAITFVISFLLLIYLVVSVIRTERDVDFMISVIVTCGAVLSGFALVESVTGYNVFNHLGGHFSFLREVPLPYSLTGADDRGGRLRVFASAQHPIALGAVLVMVLPLAIYLAKTREALRWWAAAAMLTLGVVSTVSRTGVVMLIVVGLVFLWLRPKGTKKLWPALLPLLVAVHLVMPGSLGALKEAFFPSGGIVAEQQSAAGTRGSGRLADFTPTLAEWSRSPILGEGYGSRVVDGDNPNADILDDQWLSLLLETGIVGVAAWIWIYARVLRRLVARAKSDDSKHGLLCAALSASIIAYAVGMLTYDSFSFVQVTFVLFMLIGISAVRYVPSPESVPVYRQRLLNAPAPPAPEVAT